MPRPPRPSPGSNGAAPLPPRLPKTSLPHSASRELLSSMSRTRSHEVLTGLDPPPEPPVVVVGEPAWAPIKREDSDVTIKASDSLYVLRYPDSSQRLVDADGPASTARRRRDMHIDDWPSMFVIFYTILVSESARGLVLPSLWPHLRDLGGAKQTLGIVVASFSLGRMVATVPLGFLSDHFSTSTVIAVASLVQAVGHVLYMVAPTPVAVIAARFVVGLGSATMSVCRAHVTRATTRAQRTYFFAYLSALQFVGFAVLPGLGGVLDLIPEWELWGGAVRFDEVTYPALFLVLANGVVVAVAAAVYTDAAKGGRAAAAPAQRRDGADGSGSTSYGAAVSRESSGAVDEPDWTALVVCLLLNVFFRGVVAELETVTVPVLIEYFGLSLASSSLFVGGMGFVGLGLYLSFKPIAERFSDRKLVFASVAITFAGSTLLAQPLFYPPLPLYIFGLGLIWSFGYPLGQTSALALFSKVLAGLPAGGFLGVFSATGSVARIAFALLAAGVWSWLGKRAVFMGIAWFAVATALIVRQWYHRLVPPGGV